METWEKKSLPNTVRRLFDKAHLIQSLAAGAFIFLVFLAMQILDSDLTVASLGASTFIAFSFPSSQSARTRFLVGGYCMGVISGLIGYGLTLVLAGVKLPFPAYIPACAVAVFLAMLLMTVLNFEHPPSAALAVAVATAERPVIVGIAAIVCIEILCLIRHLLRKHLKNL